MTETERLITQHVREYESRLKHIDELFERAKSVSENLEPDSELKFKLDKYREQRKELAKKADRLKKMQVSNWRKETVQSAGPMGIWDIFAQELEEFLDRHERK